MAQTVGFEPTCRFTDKLISSQPRYDHFDTSAYEHSDYINTKSKKQGKQLTPEIFENP